MDNVCPAYLRTAKPSRRAILRAGVAGFAGLNLAAALRADTSTAKRPRAKSVIFLHQFGGPSHLDPFDMKPEAPDGIRGEFKPIASSTPGIRVCEHLLNSATKRFAIERDAGAVSIELFDVVMHGLAHFGYRSASQVPSGVHRRGEFS